MAPRGFPPGDIKHYSIAGGERFEGDVPPCPDGLMPASVVAWDTWFAAWFSWFWSPDDVPALRQVIRLYDQVERGEFQRSAELRMQLEAFGITPKGQLTNRWAPMGATEPVKLEGESGDELAAKRGQRDRKLA